MAVTKLGKRDKEVIMADISHLLGRIHTGVPCPIPEADIPRIFNSLVSSDVHTLVRDAESAGYETAMWFTNSRAIGVNIGSEHRYKISSTVRRQAGKDRGALGLDHYLLRIARGKYCTDTDLHSLCVALGERADEFIDWVLLYSALRDEMYDAHKTAKKLVEVATTAGQLKRMVPSMVQYLPHARQEAMREQARASSVPYEWAAFDRARVARMAQAMAQAMAKCYLLPAAPAMHIDGTPPMSATLIEGSK